MNNSSLQLIERLWESQFFAKNIAELVPSGNALVSQMNDGEYDLIQAKVNSAEIQTIDALQQHGFRFVEGEVQFIVDTQYRSEIEIEYSSELAAMSVAKNSDILELRDLLADEFKQTRFREPFVSSEKSTQFYQLWIERAVLAEFDDICLVVRTENNQQILGAVTLKQLNTLQAKVGLIVVAKEARGQGIGRQLITMAKNWCQEKNIKQLHIATQTNNLAAIALYQKSGGVIRDINYWFYWMNVEVNR